MQSRVRKLIALYLTLLTCAYCSNANGATTTFSHTALSSDFEEKSDLTSNFGKYRPLSKCKTIEEQVLDSPSNKFRTGIENLNPGLPIKALVFNIDFDDRIFDTEKTLDFNYLSDRISFYFEAMSHDKIKFGWIYSQEPTRMPSTLKSYNAGSRSNLDEIAHIVRDAQMLAIQKYLGRDFDYLIVVTPSTVKSTEISTTLSILHSENEMINSTILSADFWTSGQSWAIPAHEIGHALGLLDLYSYESAEQVSSHTSTFRAQFHYMDFYDLMNWPTGPAPELTAWNRWQLGFLDSEEIRCLPATFTETKLEVLESSSKGIKALIYKISDYKLIVMEHRQPIGFDRALPNSATGVVVYLVNLREETGKGPLRLLKPIHKAGEFKYSSLHSQQGLTISGIKIYCVSILNSRALVRVTGT